ncbi:hypothetical protein MJO28_004225 [Puccinia striiformis f. sp. tritici]|uniref:Uncharacterized protein n=1 Tax=Puccinia striiformis f. sp. tritici TaxID=168172 RepID=A0ACC0EPW2_9BASI|nr:hypothetical protein MJO28_004225 [Puccinia striiformis f. sp. tritici]
MVHKTGVHRCPDCPKTFSRLEYVARHQRVKHLGIRAWGCHCGASYARSDLLTRHKRKCKATTAKSISAGSKCTLDDPATLPSIGQTSSITPGSQVDPPYDDNLPPSYQQAIAQQPATFTANNTFNSPDGPIQASLDRIDVPYQAPISPPRLLVEETSQITTLPQLNLTNRSGQQEAGPSSTVPTNEELNNHFNEEQNITEINPLENQSIVAIVKFSEPSFFISDIPIGSPFYLNPNIWSLAFLCQKSQGFTIPHMGSLSRFLCKATQVICPIIPMIHVPTLRAPLISIHLGYALSVAGAALDHTSEHALAFTDQSLSYKRISVQNDFLRRDRSFSFRFELLQSLLTYQFLGMFSRLEIQRERAIKFSPTIIQNFRDLGFVDILRNSPDYIQLALSGQIPLDVGWKLWVEYEVQKRTVFLILISTLQLRGTREIELKLSETNLRLPCHEDLWTASTSEEWALIARRQAMNCWLDNLESEETQHTKNIEDVVGEQSMPLLSEALAALHLYSCDESESMTRSADSSDSDTLQNHHHQLLRNQSNLTIPDIPIRANLPITVRHHRLGAFAKLVILHARALTNQATVSIRLLDHPQLNI